MAVIESTRPQGSALAGVSVFNDEPDEPLDDEAHEEQAEEHEPEAEPEYANDYDRLVAWIEDHNLARHFQQDVLDKLGMLCMREYEIDENSRAEWRDQAEKALKFATQEAQPKQYPWPKASNIIFPLITTAAIEFNARTYPAIVQNKRVVKGVVWGSDDGTPATQDGQQDNAPQIGPDGQPVWLVRPGDKRRRADRIGEHMSWQLLEEMDYWEAQTDAMTFQLPIVGGAVRKTYRDTVEGTNESELVPLMSLVWNKHAKSFARAPRHTEILTLYPDQVEDFERADETFLETVYGPGDAANEGEDAPDASDSQAPMIFLEQHRRYDLDDDGYPEPLIITIHKQTQKVVRIVARYEEEGIKKGKRGGVLRIKPLEYYSLYGFLPDPEGGSYPVGFGHLLKPMNEAVNTTINQMFDAGHLQNAGGGFIGTSLSIPAGPMNFSMGEYKPVNTKGAAIRDAVFPLPFQGPSVVLFQLLGFLVQEAKSLASTQNILSADAATLAKTAPTTMLALVEQGMQVYTAIHKRVYRALKAELNKLYRLNRLYLDKDERFKVGDTWREVKPEDYRLGGGVEPIADPTMVTDMQKLGRAGVLAEFKDDPLLNPIELRRRILEASNIENIDRILPEQPPGPSPAMQLEMQLKQAELGRIRSAEQKDIAQGVLFMAQAREKASGPELQWLESQIAVMRLRIEALNTQVKAAAVDANVHGHNTKLQGVREKAKEAANAEPGATSPPEPAPEGPQGGGLGAVAPPPGNAGLPPVSSGLPGGNPGGDLGAMGGGQAGPLG